jgi:hypothetical protein
MGETGRIQESWLKTGIDNITIVDCGKVIEYESDIIFEIENSESLKIFADDCRNLIYLVKDYCNGNYVETSWRVIATTTFGLLSVIGNSNNILTFVPGIGYFDKLATLLACMKNISEEYDKYLQWKRNSELKH